MKRSAGILVFRELNQTLEFFLVHPGGPFWKNKDLGAWSIPKGEFVEDEDPIDAAKREFFEETGITLSSDQFIPLGTAKQKSGKEIVAWACSSDFDAAKISSNTFNLEWPPRSGKYQDFPEIDKGEWFTLEIAEEKINPGQVVFLQRLINLLSQ